MTGDLVSSVGGRIRWPRPWLWGQADLDHAPPSPSPSFSVTSASQSPSQALSFLTSRDLGKTRALTARRVGLMIGAWQC